MSTNENTVANKNDTWANSELTEKETNTTQILKPTFKPMKKTTDQEKKADHWLKGNLF